MTWTTPRTWVAGEVLTATHLNAQVRDNMSLAGDPPRACVYNNTTQSVSNATLTTLNANSEVYDTDSMHDTVTNNPRLTCVTPGLYLVQAVVQFAASATVGERSVVFTDDTTTWPGGGHSGWATSANYVGANIDVQLTAGQYIKVNVTQRSGGALNVTLLRFSARWVAAS